MTPEEQNLYNTFTPPPGATKMYWGINEIENEYAYWSAGNSEGYHYYYSQYMMGKQIALDTLASQFIPSQTSDFIVQNLDRKTFSPYFPVAYL